MIPIIQNKIQEYQNKLENKSIYKETYLEQLKNEIIHDISIFNKKNRKKIFSFRSFIQNNQKQQNFSYLLNEAYNLYKQIDNIDFENFYKKELELYKKEFFCKQSFRAYKHYLKSEYQKIYPDLNIEKLLAEYFYSIFNIDIDKANEIASKQAKGRRSNNFMIEISKAVPLYDKKVKLDYDVLLILKTKEIQKIINNNNTKSHFMTAIQRKAFVVNDIFFNKILSYFILNNLDSEKLQNLRMQYSNLVKE
jgi:hypothetical protein